MSVLFLRGGCIFCVTCPALAFSCLLIKILKRCYHGIEYTSRYVEGILSLDNFFFYNLISSFYPGEIKLRKADTSDTSGFFFRFRSVHR